MENKDEILIRLGSIDTTLKFQAQQLESHIKRTELLEERFKPIEDHVKFIQSLLKLVAFAASVLAAVLKIMGKI